MRAIFPTIMALVFALSAWTAPTAQADKLGAEELVVESEFTVRKMWDHPEFSKYIRHYLRQAKGVVVIPTMLKGGFIIGGEGGSGVLLARGQNNQWSYPTFVSAGSASIGLQIGGQASEMLLIIMTGDGLRAILDDQVQIGGELTGAAGPYGASAEASTTTNLDADVIAYSISSGAYIGVNVEGTVLVPREGMIRDYYGQETSPQGVVLEGRVGNPHADTLRETLRRLVSQ